MCPSPGVTGGLRVPASRCQALTAVRLPGVQARPAQAARRGSQGALKGAAGMWACRLVCVPVTKVHVGYSINLVTCGLQIVHSENDVAGT